ncbi:MAG: hypothetical protein RIT04_250 [Candidatus Parcubacteria bacterium]|jgi:hypothetical protein
MILATLYHPKSSLGPHQAAVILQTFPDLFRNAVYQDQPQSNRARNKVFLEIREYSGNAVTPRMLIVIEVVGQLVSNHPLYSEEGCRALKDSILKKNPAAPQSLSIFDFDLVVKFASGIVA